MLSWKRLPLHQSHNGAACSSETCIVNVLLLALGLLGQMQARKLDCGYSVIVFNICCPDGSRAEYGKSHARRLEMLLSIGVRSGGFAVAFLRQGRRTQQADGICSAVRAGHRRSNAEQVFCGSRLLPDYAIRVGAQKGNSTDYRSEQIHRQRCLPIVHVDHGHTSAYG